VYSIFSQTGAKRLTKEADVKPERRHLSDLWGAENQFDGVEADDQDWGTRWPAKECEL
jgi:hypothetical protein